MAALKGFFSDAELHSRFSDGMWNALQSPETATAELTVRGKPVTFTAAPGPMTRIELLEIKELIYALPVRNGSHVIVDGPGLARIEGAEVAE
jgi:hypothetical protein